MASDTSWQKIFEKYKILEHDFDNRPFEISAAQIKEVSKNLPTTGEREVRILCKQDSRGDRPQIMQDHGLFLLPVRNGKYTIIKGEGYFDIEEITKDPEEYESKLPFELETAKVGNSEMQHLDRAYASSIVRTHMNDPSLVLTIRGRKYTGPFEFAVGKHCIEVKSVQTEVDAGYEGKDKVVLVEAKNAKTSNSIIRQLFYPYRKWSEHTQKEIFLLFFEKRRNTYMLWQYRFTDPQNYNSIELVNSQGYRLK